MRAIYIIATSPVWLATLLVGVFVVAPVRIGCNLYSHFAKWFDNQ